MDDERESPQPIPGVSESSTAALAHASTLSEDALCRFLVYVDHVPVPVPVLVLGVLHEAEVQQCVLGIIRHRRFGLGWFVF